MDYDISYDKITIYPRKIFHRAAVVGVLGCLFLGTPIFFLYIHFIGHTIGAKAFFWLAVLAHPLPFVYLGVFFYSRYQIVFDKNTTTIYSKTLWATQTLLSFEQVGKITTSTLTGTRVHSRLDPLGRGYTIYPVVNKKRAQDFELNVLPAIRAMVTSYATISLPQDNSQLYRAEKFTFYRRHPLGYVLSTPKKLLRPYLFLVAL